MNFGVLRRAAVLVTVLAATATAQVQVTVTAPRAPGATGNVIWDPANFPAFYVSPYTGTVGTQKGVTLNCVDFFHDAILNRTYSANLSSLGGSLTNTRFNNVDLYMQAAYLSQQFGSNPAADPNRSTAIQAAIWQIFDLGFYGLTKDAPNYAGQDYWVTEAKNKYATLNRNDFYILTPTNMYESGSFQEFLVYNPSTVPEPATLTLMATGLAGLAAARRRKKKLAQKLA